MLRFYVMDFVQKRVQRVNYEASMSRLHQRVHHSFTFETFGLFWDSTEYTVGAVWIWKSLSFLSCSQESSPV